MIFSALNDSMSSNNTPNSSTPDGFLDNYKGIFQKDYDTLLIILGLMIITTNGLVLFLFCKKAYLKTESNCFLISLACSDFLTGMLLIPLNIGCNTTLHPHVCISSGIITRLIYISTMFHMFAATLEKYVCVLHPLKHLDIVTMQRVLLIIIGIWVTSFVLSVVQLSWLPLGINEDWTTAETDKETTIEFFYASFLFVFCYIIPVIIVIYCDVSIFKEIKRQVKEINSQQVFNNGNVPNGKKHKKVKGSSQLNAEHRAIAIFVGMLVLFTLLWLPYQFLYFFTYLDKYGRLFETNAGVIFGDTVEFVKFCSSLFNPLMYTFLKKDFRMAFKAVILKQRRSPL